jgi:methionine synthase II (cobalamin-independent)
MASALKITFAECPELPYLPELPDRGSHARIIGRATALLSGMAVDLQPAGWRLTDGSGRDHRMAKAALREDLDLLEEVAQGYAGALKYSVAGPWTLAASVERPRGDRVVADRGARRDLVQSLAEGLVQLVGEMRRRLPDTTPLVQLDEPLMPAVFAGSVRTASGLSRHRPVDRAELSDSVRYIVEQLGDVAVLVHCCAAGFPISLMQAAGVRGVAVDIDQLGTAGWDMVGEALDAGLDIGVGAVPAGALPSADDIAARVLRPIRALELDPAVAGQLLLTPACGLADRDPQAALQVLRTLRTAAGVVTEQLSE